MIFLYKGYEVEKLDVQEEKHQNKSLILGKGSYGVVTQGEMTIRYLKTGRVKRIKVAIKGIELHKKQKIALQYQIESIKREVSIYTYVKSENIVQFYGHNIQGGSIDDKNRIEYYLELCHGSLSDLIYKSQQDQEIDLEIQALQFMCTIVATLQIIKSADIKRSSQIHRGAFHRDLNLKNILYIRKRSGRIVLKICDFGISHLVFPQEKSTLRIGTVDFMSPKNLNNEEYNLEKNDSWSLGVILFQMLFGEDKYRKDVFLTGTAENRLKLIEKQSLKISDETTELLMHLLDPNENDRWDFQEIEGSRAFCRLMMQNSSLKMALAPKKIQGIIHKFNQLQELFTQYPQLIQEMPKGFKRYVYILFKIWAERQCQRYSGQYLENSILKSIMDQTKLLQSSLVNCDKLIQAEYQNADAIKQYERPDDYYYYANKLEEIKDQLFLAIKEKEFIIKGLELAIEYLKSHQKDRKKESKNEQKIIKLQNQINERQEEIENLKQQDQIAVIERLNTLFIAFYVFTFVKKRQLEENY